MIFGFNTDVPGKDAVYHVQTEDRGAKNPVIDSIIYVGGKIVDRRRTPYVPQDINPAEIEAMVRAQHGQLVESIRSGDFAPSVRQADQAPARSGYAVRLLNQEVVDKDSELRFEFSVWSRAAGSPAAGASLYVRWMPEDGAVQEAALQTGDDGQAIVSFPIPGSRPEVTLLVCAKGDQGRELVKFHIHAKGRGSSL
jgi:hypothetical protein